MKQIKGIIFTIPEYNGNNDKIFTDARGITYTIPGYTPGYKWHESYQSATGQWKQEWISETPTAPSPSDPTWYAESWITELTTEANYLMINDFIEKQIELLRMSDLWIRGGFTKVVNSFEEQLISEGAITMNAETFKTAFERTPLDSQQNMFIHISECLERSVVNEQSPIYEKKFASTVNSGGTNVTRPPYIYTNLGDIFSKVSKSRLESCKWLELSKGTLKVIQVSPNEYVTYDMLKKAVQDEVEKEAGKYNRDYRDGFSDGLEQTKDQNRYDTEPQYKKGYDDGNDIYILYDQAQANIIAEGQTQVDRIVAEGDTQYTRVYDEGDVQDARVVAEGDTQVNRIKQASTLIWTGDLGWIYNYRTKNYYKKDGITIRSTIGFQEWERTLPTTDINGNPFVIDDKAVYTFTSEITQNGVTTTEDIVASVTASSDRDITVGGIEYLISSNLEILDRTINVHNITVGELIDASNLSVVLKEIRVYIKTSQVENDNFIETSDKKNFIVPDDHGLILTRDFSDDTDLNPLGLPQRTELNKGLNGKAGLNGNLTEYFEASSFKSGNFQDSSGNFMFYKVGGDIWVYSPLDMKNNRIKGLANPIEDTDGVNKQYADSKAYVNGDITQLFRASKLYTGYIYDKNGNKVLTVINGRLDLSSTLNMNTNKIANVEDPTNPQDAATKKYVDGDVLWTGSAEFGETISIPTLSQYSSIKIRARQGGYIEIPVSTTESNYGSINFETVAYSGDGSGNISEWSLFVQVYGSSNTIKYRTLSYRQFYKSGDPNANVRKVSFTNNYSIPLINKSEWGYNETKIVEIIGFK